MASSIARAAACVGAAYVANKLYRFYVAVTDQERCMRELHDKMSLPLDLLTALRDEMVEQMRNGLNGDRSSEMLMLPSMVDFLPNGHETGQFLAIDIGGSNMRTCYVKLSDTPGQIEDVRMESQTIPDAYRRCHIDDLFSWIASTMVEFIKSSGITLEDEVPTLGFCFSFPMHQETVNSGSIVLWTKGFHITGSDGVDLVTCLESAFIRAGLPCRVSVLINDTVGTLCASRYADQDTAIGLILGTGFNACYVEDVQRVNTLPSTFQQRSHLMVINTECGGFHSSVLPVLDEDVWVASASKPYGLRIEKVMSGLYLGEVVRRLIVRMVERHALLGHNVLHHGLHDAINKLTTADVAAIHGDTDPQLSVTASVLFRSFGIVWMPHRSRRLVQQLCVLACTRSARLLATTIAALLRQTERDGAAGGQVPRTVVAIDGGMYEKYPQFREAVLHALDELLGVSMASKVEIRLTPDGSSLGAAGLAAAAVRDVPLSGKEKQRLRTLSMAVKRQSSKSPRR